MESRDHGRENGEASLALVGLVDDLADVEQAEECHRGHDDNQQPGVVGPEPDKSCENKRSERGERNERCRLHVDPERTQLAVLLG
jgi:hypothetical protein